MLRIARWCQGLSTPMSALPVLTVPQGIDLDKPSIQNNHGSFSMRQEEREEGEEGDEGVLASPSAVERMECMPPAATSVTMTPDIPGMRRGTLEYRTSNGGSRRRDECLDSEEDSLGSP